MNYFNYEDCSLLIPDFMKNPEKYGFDVVLREGGIGIAPKEGVNMGDLRCPGTGSSEYPSKESVNKWIKAYREGCWQIDKQNAIDVTAENVTEGE
jgi:hypothetical protein